MTEATPFERVELPSGAWADLRDPEATTEAQRRPVKRLAMRVALNQDLLKAMKQEGSIADLSDDQLDLLFDFNEALTVALVESWSFDKPITRDGLQSIPGKGDYEALTKAAAAHRDALMPNFDVTPDPASPTEPSADLSAT